MIETCAACRFFHLLAKDSADEPVGTCGECRRHPPTINAVATMKDVIRMESWPYVGLYDWCGEYQPRDDAGPNPASEEA